MTWRVKDFEPSDIPEHFFPQEHHLFSSWREELIESAKGEATLTAYYDEILMGFGGIKFFWQGVAEAWMMVGKNFDEYKKDFTFCKSFLRLSKTVLTQAIAQHQLWRVQAHVRSDHPTGLRLARHLGFLYEGEMKKFTPDKKSVFLVSLT